MESCGLLMNSASITIELFGVPRARAGCSEIQVVATTVREAIEKAIQQCAGLNAVINLDFQRQPQSLLSLDGRTFITDLDQPLKPGDRLLLLSADAGG